jgi:hypothetical protein
MELGSEVSSSISMVSGSTIDSGLKVAGDVRGGEAGLTLLRGKPAGGASARGTAGAPVLKGKPPAGWLGFRPASAAAGLAACAFGCGEAAGLKGRLGASRWGGNGTVLRRSKLADGFEAGGDRWESGTDLPVVTVTRPASEGCRSTTTPRQVSEHRPRSVSMLSVSQRILSGSEIPPSRSTRPCGTTAWRLVTRRAWLQCRFSSTMRSLLRISWTCWSGGAALK